MYAFLLLCAVLNLTVTSCCLMETVIYSDEFEKHAIEKGYPTEMLRKNRFPCGFFYEIIQSSRRRTPEDVKKLIFGYYEYNVSDCFTEDGYGDHRETYKFRGKPEKWLYICYKTEKQCGISDDVKKLTIAYIGDSTEGHLGFYEGLWKYTFLDDSQEQFWDE